MRAPSLTAAVYLCAAVAGAITPACANSSGAGSETHFVCTGDSDCNAGTACIDRMCVPTKDSGVVKPVVESGAPEAGPPTNMAACPGSADVVALDDGCTDAVCHTVIRLDYLTLAPHGWSSTGSYVQVVDANTARIAGGNLFARDCMYCNADPTVTSASAGIYRVFATPSDFGAFALVGARSGLVVTAGGVTWAGRGNYFVPATWKSASDIRCGIGSAVAAETFIDSGGCETGDGKSGASPDQALALALRTNLARGYAQKGAFSAYVYLYTPTVGGCEPSVAEYLIVLSR